MIIKDQILENQLRANIGQITINSSQKIEGSYKFKPYGSFVSDIDYTVYSKTDKKLINTIKRLISIKNRFIFIHISSGTYSDFIPPWRITDTGCNFNYIEAVEWYQNIKPKLDIETSSIIEGKLFSKTLTIRDIVEIDLQLEKYKDIKWTEDDIMRGYKIDDSGIRYDLLDTMKKNHSVLKFLFIYSGQTGPDYIPVDIGIIEKNKREGILQKCNSFYTENWYKVFKSLKWKIKPEYKHQYFNALEKIDYQNALLNRLKMLKKIITKKLISQEHIIALQSKIEAEIRNPLSHISDTDLNLELMINTVEKNISLEIEEDAKYFIDKLKNQDDITLKKMYFDRAVIYGTIPVTVKKLFERSSKGIRCPFFELDDREYNFLYKTSVDFLLDPIQTINSFIQVANEADLLVRDVVNIEVEPNIFLKCGRSNIEVYKRESGSNIKIRDIDKKHLKAVQKYLIINIFS